MSAFRPIYKILLIFIFCYLPVQGISQAIPLDTFQDSVLFVNDSLQDIKIEGIEREIRQIKRNWETYQINKDLETDSLLRINEGIIGELDKLDLKNEILKEEIAALQNKLNHSMRKNEDFRVKLATILWVSGPVILLIIIIIFLILFLKNRRLRILLMEQIEGVVLATDSELKQIGHDIREERSRDIKKRVKIEIRKKLKAKVKEEVKTEVKKRMPKFRRKRKK